MSGILIEIARQINYFYGTKRTPFNTNTTTNAELFANKSDLIIRRNLDTEFTCFDNWTETLALLVASSRLATVLIDDSNTIELGLAGI